MNLKELATEPTIILRDGKQLAKISDHNELSLFINPQSFSERFDQKGFYTAEFAISPGLNLKETDEDLELITKLIQLFSHNNSLEIKLSSHGHIYFDSLHSVYGKQIESPIKKHNIKMTYIRTHLSKKKV